MSHILQRQKNDQAPKIYIISRRYAWLLRKSFSSPIFTLLSRKKSTAMVGESKERVVSKTGWGFILLIRTLSA